MLVDALEKVVRDLVVIGHGPRVVRDDVKRVLEAPHAAYHAHVRALAAHSNQKKSFLKKDTQVIFFSKSPSLRVFSISNWGV